MEDSSELKAADKKTQWIKTNILSRIFVGSPGTGKTASAKALSMLINNTAKGGALIIDEAYSLLPENQIPDDQKKIATTEKLHTAIKDNDIPTINAILDNDGSYFLNVHGRFIPITTTVAPLLTAATYGRSDVVRRLLSKVGIEVNGSWFNTSPLYAAIKEGHTETAKILIDAGADPCAHGMLQASPFVQAANNNNADLLCYMLGKMTEDQKHRALIHTQTSYNLKELKAILQYVDIDTPDKDGKTFLMKFCNYSKGIIFTFTPAMTHSVNEYERAFLKALITSGADLRRQDTDGKSALDYAATRTDGGIFLEILQEENLRQIRMIADRAGDIVANGLSEDMPIQHALPNPRLKKKLTL